MTVTLDQSTSPATIYVDTSKESGYLSGIIGGKLDAKTHDSFLSSYSRLKPDEPFTVNLTTNGGAMLYSLLIANIIANHKGKTRVEIPLIAMSGGTIIALMADEIAMDQNACLGSIDLQMMLPIKSIIPTVKKHKDNSILCSIAYDLLNRYQSDYLTKVKELMKMKYPETFNKILNFFYHRYSHEIPLFLRDMPDILNVQSLEVKQESAPPAARSNNPGMDSMLSLMSQLGNSSKSLL